MMSGSKTNRFMKALMDSIKKTVPQLFHKCPYKGRYELLGFSITKPFVDLIPAGSYKMSFKFNVTEPSVLDMIMIFSFNIS